MTTNTKHYWLFKSEPNVFGIDDLANSPRQRTRWDGVRNYQVRNLLRDVMGIGDEGFFYHSSCPEPGIVGTVRVVSNGYADPTASDPKSPYFDPKSDPKNPRWFAVDVELQHQFRRLVSLTELRAHEQLRDMMVLRRGNRLSITPVTTAEWKYISRFANSA